MVHAYSHLFNLLATGLRFFPVYGPWGRPDVAYFSSTKAILEDRPIDVYNRGNMKRDFTYIDDIVEGAIRVLDRVPGRNEGPATGDRGSQTEDHATKDESTAVRSSAPYRLYNIGNHTPVDLLYFIEVLEKCLGKKAEKRLLPMQPGDVVETFADADALTRDVGFVPGTRIEVGVERVADWFRRYYRL
jgi:UDP-glucuronate 4-epimerase